MVLEKLRRGTHRKQHVLFVLVDSPWVRNRVGVFDDRHRLPLRQTRAGVR